ncbi:ComE operon protein 2 [Lentibacillus juripiscarius]|uniref:ComE operon protein 2 n=1 Tax=Lentibacillus juripiscarius TaxID=257446 RepID=A0ABW5V113_9BACI
MKRIPWDQYFMAQSHLLAMRSTCTRLMVGATIVRDKRIIAGGYNGSVSGGVHCIDEGCYIMDGHCVRTIHAEANALLQCAKFGVPTDGAEMYVTHFPCLQCCKQIIQSGMKAVYYATDYKNHPYALSLFEDAGVETKKVELTELSIDANYQDKDAYVKRLLAELERQTTNQEKFQALQTEAESLFRL